MLRRSSRRWLLCLAGVAITAVVTAAHSWACASLMAIDVKPAGVVKPGQEVDVLVTFVHNASPVELRWNALNGPLLATIDKATFTEGLHGNWRFASAKITIPADARPGNYLLIANQEFSRTTALWGSPARALVQVSPAGQPVVGQEVGGPREVLPDTLVTEDSISMGQMLVAALGVAGATLLLAGAAIVVVASRRKSPQAAVVRTDS